MHIKPLGEKNNVCTHFRFVGRKMSSKLTAGQHLQEFFNAGFKQSKQLSELTKIPLRTVQRILKKIKSGESTERKAGSGCPQKLDVNNRQRVSQLAIKHEKWSCARIASKLLKAGGPKVSRWTVERILKEKGYMKLIPKIVPPLTEDQKRKRVDWCQKYCTFDFSKVCISDESTFQLYRTKLRVWCKNRKTKGVPKYSPQVMVWGAISERGTTPLCFIKGTVNSEKYIEIMNECLLETMSCLYPDGWTFQQDNASCHVSKKTKEWLAFMKIQVLDWPANSPDLSPIENLWQIVKNRLEIEEPRTIAEWTAKISEIWDEVSPDLLKTYLGSMSRRMELCIAAKGEHIKY